MNTFIDRLIQHPAGMLYGILLAVIAVWSTIPAVNAGNWETAVVDLIMAGVLLYSMSKTLVRSFRRSSGKTAKITAWILLGVVNLLLLIPSGEFPGSLSRAFAGALLIYAVTLTFSGPVIAWSCIAPTLWCCVYIPYHEELMLFASYPLRLSATMLSAEILRFSGLEILYSGTSINLPGLQIAITDACSGINQLDAFLLIAFLITGIMHKKTTLKILHFAFIIPAIIAGNTIRIVLTVFLYRTLGNVVLNDIWHTSLGYVQIVLALIFFIIIGRILAVPPENAEETKP